MTTNAFLDDQPVIGESPVFQDMLDQVSRLAALDRPALIIGERGTGKELIAARLHFLSPRWERPLIRLNCAALTESLLETELFGHEAGAFTSATRRHVGRFELADGGSLFLDELANTSLRLQEKVLRVVEYGEFERVGGSQTLRVDVRIIGATNMDLPALADQGKFRADLLDRLAFAVVTIPPLRARGDDVLLLADRFGAAMARDLGLEFFPGFAPAAREALLAHPWPGNVRELKNVVERAAFNWAPRTEPVEQIEFDPFASPYRPAPAIPDTSEGVVEKPAAQSRDMKPALELPLQFKEVVQEFEKGLIQRALEKNRYNQRRTARDLGLSYHQLRGHMRKYGLR